MGLGVGLGLGFGLGLGLGLEPLRRVLPHAVEVEPGHRAAVITWLGAGVGVGYRA